MELIELTLPTAAENVALDEALLLSCQTRGEDVETLRLWEPSAPLVVLGRSSPAADEVDLAACRRDGVPVVRRASGGAAIVGAPGCLMYALVLSYARRPALRAIDQAHRFVLDALAAAIEPLAAGVRRAGISDLVLHDLTLGDRKVSGNSLRLLRTHLLYHGTLLYDLSPQFVAGYLREPARQPAYRRGRSHVDFISRLPTTRAALAAAVRAAFGATSPSSVWPSELTRQLVTGKYSRAEWNFCCP